MSASSDVELNGLHPADLAGELGPGSRDDLGRFDPVLATVADRPAAATPPPVVDPTADHADPEVAHRRLDVDAKHKRIIALLDATGHDAALLTRADSIAWFTAGGDLGRGFGSEQGSVAVFVNRACRAVLADNVQSARAFEEEVAGLGFQLKERPWHQDPWRIVAELTHGRSAASDGPAPGLSSEPGAFRSLRFPLTTLERRNLRALGRSLALAIESTCRAIRPGDAEADVAGQLAHRLIREGIAPVDLRVAGDDRPARYRRPNFKGGPIRRHATITVAGRRQGLCASASRMVAFGPVEPGLAIAHTVASMVDATCIYFSRPGEPVSEVFRRARRIYEKFDHPDEWMLDYQGGTIGYAPRETLLLPDSAETLRPGIALNWSPSVGAARSEDTIVIDDRGYEVVTEAQDWPKIDVSVKGFVIHRPAILER